MNYGQILTGKMKIASMRKRQSGWPNWLLRTGLVGLSSALLNLDVRATNGATLGACIATI